MPLIELKDNLIGGLDLDDSYYELSKNRYVDALNITKDAVEQSQDLVITNIVGNRFVPYNKPSGTNVTIGAKSDTLRNRVFEFMWNSNNYHSIIIYDNNTRTRTKLIENLTDTNNEDVLQFTRNNKIIHCDIIYRGEDEGDLLFWTDGNVSPRKLNVKHIQGGDYTYIKVPFIELAKMPPINPIQAVYGNDTTRNANSLRKKLVMATYRWSYDDFEKSTFTTYSKIPLPIGYYGSDNDIDNNKNNFITFTVETGDENVTEIEIAVRFNTENTWDDFVLAISLNKEQLGIPNNSTYQYLFYNDGIYPPLDVEEVIQLFDWVPKKAKSQCNPNGNVIALGAITEGYNNYPVNDLDVTITAENMTNIPPDADPPSMTYELSGLNPGELRFQITGTVTEGTVYNVSIGTPASVGEPITLIYNITYTAQAGDTLSDVGLGLVVDGQTNYPGPPNEWVDGSGGAWSIFPIYSPYLVSVNIQVPAPSGDTISTEKTWLPDSNYIFAQGYKDEQGRLMPGLTTFINPTDSDNDYLVTTPSFSQDTGAWQTPVITAEVNHLPYAGSVSVAWARRRMTYADFLFYETCDFQDPSDGFLYFCLDNITQYKEDNNQFIYGTVPITSESRIKIIAGISSGAYTSDIWDQDYEILGTVIRTLTSGSSPDDDKTFIKVKKPTASISPSYTVNMLVMVYTPMSNPTSIEDSVFYEWGEEYEIYTGYTIAYSSLSGAFEIGETITGNLSGATAIITGDDSSQLGISDLSGTFEVGETITGSLSGETATIDSISDSERYHRGMTQDQTSFQPAIYVWEEGDVYFHTRTMYNELLTSPYASDTVSIMDANFSDFFDSAVNDNGRGLSIEVNARETYFPATIRFSREYQQNTNINQTNRFVYNNFIDLDRSFGGILKMSIKDRYIRIGQQFKIGLVPIFNQISKDATNSTLVASTDQLLNPVQYYLGDYGIGDAPEAWVDYNSSSYFFYTFRGIWCRLSQDGITPISVIYKINSWATDHGVSRGSDYKIYGVYDPKSNNCIFSFEATDIDDSYTISFDEDNNSYESFLSYHPEMMTALGSLLISWKNGDLWTHDSDSYNTFYGVKYPSTITIVWNQDPSAKKVFNAIAYQGNDIWASPTDGDIQTSMVNPQTSLPQISQLKEVDYETQENVRYASFLRDSNSMSDSRLALVEGDYLNGTWIKTKLICTADKADKLIYFSMPYVISQASSRNY